MTKMFTSSLRIAAVLMLGATLSGCMISAPPSRGGTGAQSLIPDAGGYDVRKVNVIVPRDLVVSEENTYKPAADIVWHGEAQGNRYQQVESIVRAAMQAGTAGYRSGHPVVIDVQVTRFHALTPKTRASIGGKHELEYMLTLRDAASGGVLRMVPNVKATVRGAGGAAAQAEEAAGRSQAVVIREALVASVQRELGGGAKGGGMFAAVARGANVPSQAPLN